MNSRAIARGRLYKDHHVVTLMGRFGNQLFQYSFAQWLHAMSGYPVVFDLSQVRTLERVPVGLRSELAARALPTSSRWPAIGGRADKVARIARRGVGPREIIEDLSAIGVSQPVDPDPAWWVGYWQRLEYARHSRRELQKRLNLDDYTPASTPACAVQVRRGDYVGLGISLTREWFIEQMERVSDEMMISKFIIVSDDINWCRQNLLTKAHISFVENSNPIEDLRIIAKSTVKIISPSTFAWWGAFLGEGTTYYPSPWDSTDVEVDSVLIPESWRPLRT